MLELVESRDIHTYGEIDPLRAAEVSTDWKLYYAYILGEANPVAYRGCPTFLGFAERTPCVVNAIIAILAPG